MVHFCGSMDARKSVTVMAPVGQTLAHIMQPMQPAEHTLRTSGPLSWLEQRTATRLLTGAMAISRCGQA